MKALILMIFGGILVASEKSPLITHTNHIKDRYIVKFKYDNQTENFRHILEDVEIFFRYNRLFNGFTANMTEEQVEMLLEADEVDFIEEDEVVKASSVASWGLDRIDQGNLPLDQAFNPRGDGRDVDLYLVDSGINEDHNDFGGRVSFGIDALGETGDDCDGHGTHVAGIAGGSLYGVAKSVHLINVRVLNCVGLGTVSGILAASEWIISNAKKTNRPSIASFSLNGDESTLLDAAVQDLVDEGITVVVAAGNENTNACNYSPARSTYVLTVGATTRVDARADSSNFGPCVDIFAPGHSIVATSIGSNTAISTQGGTSMAVPHVSGAAAIFLGNDPELTPKEVMTEILSNATDGVLSNIGQGSPNRLVFVGYLGGDKNNLTHSGNSAAQGSGSTDITENLPLIKIPKECVVKSTCAGFHLLNAYLYIERPLMIASGDELVRAGDELVRAADAEFAVPQN